MLMAMESSELLADAIIRHANIPTELYKAHTTAYQERFGRRLKVSGAIRRIAYSPLLSGGVISALSLNRSIRNRLARLTRGPSPLAPDDF
jgi:hypothetical protein